ncbi:hypothetical protein FOL47_004858 [Perkinsus chesapeaki]|uniref:Uncharacterized protein n=1 Tax=Perkinsus chesapeaki TaxID=330153 RepID=A0A7J6M0D0_PERCH|nr:hypothetical protein FOL47_004858 [Perkinsus chesapeaki]
MSRMRMLTQHLSIAEKLIIEKLQLNLVYGATERKAFQKLLALTFQPGKAIANIDLHAAEIRELAAISLPKLDAVASEVVACKFFWNSIPWTAAAKQLYCTWQAGPQHLNHALDLCRTLYDDDDEPNDGSAISPATAGIAHTPKGGKGSKGKGRSTKGQSKGDGRGATKGKGSFKGGQGQYRPPFDGSADYPPAKYQKTSRVPQCWTCEGWGHTWHDNPGYSRDNVTRETNEKVRPSLSCHALVYRSGEHCFLIDTGCTRSIFSKDVCLSGERVMAPGNDEESTQDLHDTIVYSIFGKPYKAKKILNVLTPNMISLPTAWL